MQAELQQNPSEVQKLLVQSESALQSCPMGSFVPQVLVVLRQVSPPVQFASEAQVLRHEGLVELH